MKMGWFSKKKDDDYLDILNEEETLEESFFVPFGQQKNGGIQPSHALTAKEVEQTQDENISMEGSNGTVSPLDALRSRVMQQAAEKQAAHEQLIRDEEQKQKAIIAEQERRAAEEAEQEEQQRIAAEQAAEEAAKAAAQERLEKAQTELLYQTKEPVDEQNTVCDFENTQENSEACAVTQPEFEDIDAEHFSNNEATTKPQKPLKTNLLEKCTPFILDDDGNSAIEEKPAYTLESVESILGIPEKETPIEQDDEVCDSEDTDNFEKSPVKENPIITSETIVMERSAFNAHGIVSDIDSQGVDEHIDPTALSATTAFTRRFDPIPGQAGKNTTTFTRIHDLKSGIAEATEKQAAEEKLVEDIFGNDDENDFEPKDEYLCLSDAKRIGKKLKIAKRNAFYSSVISFICLVLSGIFSLPFFVVAFSGAPVVHAVLQCCLAGAAVLANIGVWTSLSTLFGKHTSPEISVAVAEVLAGVCIALDFGSVTNVCYTCLLMCFILFARSACHFSKVSFKLSNFRFVASSKKKNAVTLIDDRPTTLSMASGSIDGDVLVAATRRITNVTDYMKNAEAPTEFEGRFKIIFIAFLVAAALCGFAGGGITGNAVNAVFCAFCVIALLCAPTLVMCDILPLKYAAQRLNRRGAMISGKPALNKLEMANACVMRSIDFFPRGTVTLHNLQVLSENNIERTLLEAAAVTSALKSPIAGILCDIACNGDSDDLPRCDSVKYENKMGISGWVGNNRLFIGNYDLLEAHGITPPDFEVVKKLMRKGYFPVFIACNQKACALLTVKYNISASVANELVRISNMGVTMLVNNCDANLSEEMLCDYFGLYSDSIRIMNDAGLHMYKNRVNYVESSAAPAVHSDQPAILPTILSTAIKAKRAITILRIMHIVFSALGALLIAFLSFNRSDITVNGMYILIYEAIVSLIAWVTGLLYRVR